MEVGQTLTFFVVRMFSSRMFEMKELLLILSSWMTAKSTRSSRRLAGTRGSRTRCSTRASTMALRR